MRSTLVFGANGYLGRQLCWWLHGHRFHVTASSRQNEAVTGLPVDTVYFPLDLLDKAALTAAPVEADMIFLFTGRTGTTAGFSRYEDFVQANEISLLNVLAELKKRKFAGRLIFPSTRLVYRGKRPGLLKEEDEKDPKTTYAINKLACEQHLQAWRNAFGLEFTIYRICVPFGLVGPGAYNYGTLGFMIRQALEKKEITLYGDGSLRRTFTDIRDLCEIMTRASILPQTAGKILNIGSRDHISLLEAANQIAKRTGASVKLVPWPELDLAIESGDTAFSDVSLQTLFPHKYVGDLTSYLETLRSEQPSPS